MRVKKAESTTRKMVEEEDGKGLQKVEQGGKRGLSKRVKMGKSGQRTKGRKGCK